MKHKQTTTLNSIAPTLLAHVVLASAAFAQCGATVSIPAFNTTWTIQNSPYCVTTTIQVGNLTIDPGVEVRIAPGASLQVVSSLRANGTRTQPVVFRAADLASGRWGGIVFAGPVVPGNPSVLDHCVITEAGAGGVSIVDNEQVSLVGCSIRDNTTTGNGGGLWVHLVAGTVLVDDCDFTGNTAPGSGGGVYAVTTGTGALHLRGCRIADNRCNPAQVGGTHEGGGVWAAGALQLESCLIRGNRTGTWNCGSNRAVGGGAYLSAGTITIDSTHVISNSCEAYANCTIPGNYAEGGGVFAASTVANLTMRNSLVCCNSAIASGYGTSYVGAGLQTAATTTTLENCTLANNSQVGVRVLSGGATLRGCIVWGHPVANIQGTATATYCDVQNGYAGTGNIPFNPAFVGAGCEPEHFMVSNLSPCIDAGDPAASNDDACRSPGQGATRNDIGATGGPSNCELVGPALVACGAQRYGSLRQPGGDITLDWTFAASQPSTVGTISLANGTPLAPAAMLLGFQPALAPLSGTIILVNLAGATPLPIVLSNAGTWSAPLNLNLPFLVGLPVFLQAVELPPNLSARASNGLRFATCP